MADLTKEIIWDYMRDTVGWVTSSAIDRDLTIGTPSGKSNRRVYLLRLVNEGKLKRHPVKDGIFKCIDSEAPQLCWEDKISVEPLDIEWPFGLEHWIEIYSKNLVVLAGDPNAGKTAFCLNFAALNMNTWPVFYYSSELGEEELAKRLTKFDIDEWKVTFRARSEGFEEIIEPDAINIIDYLEVEDNFWLIGRELTHIYRVLNKGIALVAIQKDPRAKLGVGKRFGLDRPRLYLTMEPNKLTIEKGKNWAIETVNPNKKAWTFKLIGGAKFVNIKQYYSSSIQEELL